MLDRLFVYGTLHPSRAPAEIAAVVRRFVLLGEGTVRGRLHRFADYPALQLEAAGEHVHGAVFRVPPEAWPALDAYEGYTPASPAGSLFLREQTEVRMTGGTPLPCWIYTYAAACLGRVETHA